MVRLKFEVQGDLTQVITFQFLNGAIKIWRVGYSLKAIRNFNSLMVRLKLYTSLGVVPFSSDFNSLMVRLKFASYIQDLSQLTISIP